jgi:hypothetical protein
MPNMSDSPHSSTILPSTMRLIPIPFPATRLPVAGMPKNSPLWVICKIRSIYSKNPLGLLQRNSLYFPARNPVLQ